MKEKCIIFGASKTGLTAFGLLHEEYDIIGFSDNDAKKWGRLFCERKIYAPEELKSMLDTKIIIASVYYSLIHGQLKDMGLCNIQVFYYLGSASYNNGNSYKLYEISDTKLFQNCIYDEVLIQKIRQDFTKNYETEMTLKRVVLPETDRKKVLFCAYIFPPLGGSGVQRSLKFVKYLRKYGYEPVVLTVGENDGKIIQDATLLQEIPEGVTILRVDNKVFLPECLTEEEQQQIYNLYCGITKSEKWMGEYLSIINNSDARLIPDNKMIWVNECLKQINQLIDLNEIDIVYTTGNPYSDYVLGYYLKNTYGMKWVQDYRDPWTANQYYLDEYYNIGITEKLQVEMENNLVKNADATIVLAEAIATDFVEKFHIDRQQLHIITNGYDEDDFSEINTDTTKNDKFTLCYNGTIYINRNPINTICAINQLIEENKIDADKIQWVFNGALEEKWKKQINEADTYNIVIYNGSLTHLESIKTAINADMLVLFGATGKGAEVVHTGKVFEYLRMKKDILCFSSKGGVLEHIMEETNAGRNFEYDDIIGVKEYILQKYIFWKEENQHIDVNENAILKYSREYSTKLLSKIFDELLEKNRRK